MESAVIFRQIVACIDCVCSNLCADLVELYEQCTLDLLVK